MRKRLLTACAVIATGFSFGQAVNNGGFENWDLTNYDVPQYYFSSDFNHSKAGPMNTVQTTDAYHGTFAVNMITVTMGSTNQYGFVANGSPGSTYSGGVPYSQQPTGVRLYYKSNIVGNDSATILAQFKKGGSNIGFYIFKIGASASSYTLFTSTFSPALTMAPDTVIFGAASSDVYNGTANLGNMLQIDSVSFTGVTSQPANFNGDFEVWNPMTNYECSFWSSFSPPAGEKQTTDAHSGLYAMEVSTFPDVSKKNKPTAGFIVNGSSAYRGAPYTLQSDSLFFYYKYVTVNPDTAFVSVFLVKAGSTVGTAFYPLYASSSYKHVKMAISSSIAPDTLIVQFISSASYPVRASCIGSDLKVDDVYLKSEPLFVKEWVSPSAISIQPNPSNGIFHIVTSGLAPSSIQRVLIFNTRGSLVQSRGFPNANAMLSEQFDISNLSEGMYLVQIQTTSGIISKKITKTN